MTHSHPSRRVARIVAPAAEPLSLSETKLYLRVEHDSEDALISGLIVAAREAAERHLGRSLITQTWQLAFDGELPGDVRLPYGPVTAITALRKIDEEGGSETVSSTLYALDASRTGLILDTSVCAFRVELEYTAGYGASGSSVPAPIRYGMLAHVAALYENRGEGEPGLPAQAQSLYAPFREVRL